MLRHYIYTVSAIVIAAGMGLTGCVKDDTTLEQPSIAADQPTLELQICRSGVDTRADADGTAFTAAEKLVNTVDLFFFATGATDSDPAKLAVTVVKPQMNTEPAKSNTGTMVVSVDPVVIWGDAYDATKSSGEYNCVVYAVVNADAKGTLGNTPTLKSLKDLAVTSEKFVTAPWKDETKTTDGEEKFEGFVMFSTNPGGDGVKLDMAEKKMTGEVHVSKPASKIELLLGFGDGSGDGTVGNSDSWFTIESKDPNKPESAEKKIWRVYFDEEYATRAFIVNGVKTVQLGAFEGAKQPDWYFDLWKYDTDTPAADMDNYAHGFAKSSAVSGYPYVTEAPFYTYPNEWSTDMLEQHRTYLILKVNWIPVDTAEDEIENALVETYYMIPFNVGEDAAKNNKVAPNTHYRIKVKINTMGGRHFGEPVILDNCSYEILPWGNNALDATLRETRYLEIKQSVYDKESNKSYAAIMNNTETVTIPFTTSHKVEIRNASVMYYNYYTTTNNNGILSPTEPTTNITRSDADAFTLTYDLLNGDNNYAGVYIDEIGSKITIKHKYYPIEKEGDHYIHETTRKYNGKTYDGNVYSPYVIKITLKHIDYEGIDFDQTIEVIQYPPMYVSISSNTGGDQNRVRTGALTYGNRLCGYVRINGTTSKSSTTDRTESYYGGVYGMATNWWSNLGNILSNVDSSTNPNMYIIHVTVLNEDDAPMHIGDPRMLHVKNNLTTDNYRDSGNARVYEPMVSPKDDSEINSPASWSNSFNAWNNGVEVTPTRKLTYYYPTDETPLEENSQMVSPVFRIASSYGNLPPTRALAGVSLWDNRIERHEARMRCASYQEFGYPAGRWRLPTLGEMSYVAQLSYIGIIPQLFDTSESYWTSQGLYKITVNAAGKAVATEDTNRDGLLNASVTGHVRCVYDDWYWVKADGSEDNFTDRGTFRWGDRRRNNPQKQ